MWILYFAYSLVSLTNGEIMHLDVKPIAAYQTKAECEAVSKGSILDQTVSGVYVNASEYCYFKQGD